MVVVSIKLQVEITDVSLLVTAWCALLHNKSCCKTNLQCSFRPLATALKICNEINCPTHKTAQLFAAMGLANYCFSRFGHLLKALRFLRKKKSLHMLIFQQFVIIQLCPLVKYLEKTFKLNKSSSNQTSLVDRSRQ